MRCILDLGTQKTGSKCRQRFFTRQGRRIAGRRLCYPASGRGGGPWHRPLYNALSGGDAAPLHATANEARATGADLMILSYEELHKLSVTAIEQLAACFPDLDAVVFLRRQDSFVNSFHNQLHKAHRVPLAEIKRFEARLGDYDPHLDYDAMLTRWGQVLGPRRVHPVCYDKQVSPVASFFNAVDIGLDLADYIEPRPNPAIDRFGLAVLREVKQRVGDAPDLMLVMREAHRVLAAHFVATAGAAEPDTLGPALRARIMARYRAGNARICARFFPGQAELFPPLPPAAPQAEMPTGAEPLADGSTVRRLADAILSAVQVAGRG